MMPSRESWLHVLKCFARTLYKYFISPSSVKTLFSMKQFVIKLEISVKSGITTQGYTLAKIFQELTGLLKNTLLTQAKT